jgi:3'-5' exoribonuclease
MMPPQGDEALAHQLITQLKEGAAVHQFLLLRQVENRLDKAGKPFLALLLGDKSGVLEARVWSEAVRKCPGPFAPGDYVAVQGRVESYKGELQINVDYLNTVERLRAMGRDLKDFEPNLLHLTTPHDREELWQELSGLAETHLNPPLKELVLALLEKHREDILSSPGAQLYHHPYLGGLLEHTWSVTRHALQALSIYPGLNADLVLAGAILHDLGKVKELAIPQAPERTPAGHLLGHIVLGWEMVREAARTLNFPNPDLLLQLEHIILSHHGSQEFGSPVVPLTREAMLVYYLDEIDSKLKMMDQHLESAGARGEFTSYHKVLKRVLYKGGERPPEEGAGPEEK